MANAWLNLYKGSPTSGGTDGSPVSTGDNSSPLTFTLDAALNEVASDTVALRCETGFKTVSDTSVTIMSDTANHWALSLDGTNWSTSVTITDTVVATNTTFFVRAGASSSENPSNDSSVKIRVRTKIAAV